MKRENEDEKAREVAWVSEFSTFFISPFTFWSFCLVPLLSKPDFPPFMKAVVTVMPKPAILDPAGVATGRAMEHLGLKGVRSIRIGKSIEIEVDGADEKQLHEICHDLLSNPVVEDYKLEILS
jgi:phosphoribosylformylglycinamidine synthase